MKSDTGLALTAMQVDGGITRSDKLMQRQADVSQIGVNRPENIETTALGAAMMAGYKLIWNSFEELQSLNTISREYHPKVDPQIIRREFARWNTAVERSRDWA
jgi:glycerol kinase